MDGWMDGWMDGSIIRSSHFFDKSFLFIHISIIKIDCYD